MKITNIKTIELFAGAGGLALGLEKAGIKVLALNDFDKSAIDTLKINRPNWNVIDENIEKITETDNLNDFFKIKNHKIDLITGGFPCQPFSFAGKKLGTKDKRGNLYKYFGNIVNHYQPKIFMAENVYGLLTIEKGQAFQKIKKYFEDLGYKIFYQILNANDYKVAQKRKRLFIVGVEKSFYQIKGVFIFPEPKKKKLVLKNVLKNVPTSLGVKYNEKKRKILEMIPPGGCWRNLPTNIAKNYLMKSYYLGGGKTGIARRLSYSEPCLTLTTSPFQKQTERCHPEFTRPFTVREYARIQSFPDSWKFSGSIMKQYKQIGNAVPVNLAYYMGLAIVEYFKK